MITLLASAARTVTAGATAAVPEAVAIALAKAKCALYMLDVTAAATDVGDTLDVYIQSSIDGTTWDDFIHFTQVLGNGGAKKLIAAHNSTITPTTAMGPAVDGALAAGVKQGPVGSQFRIKYVIVDADANASFTFSIKCQPYL